MPMIRCVTAPNPSPLTGPGTNTFLIGQNEVAVIDPGPDDPSHLDAIEAEVKGQGGQIALILVTHAHIDHSAGAAALAHRSGAQIAAFATPSKPAQAELGGGEGIDSGFRPDRPLVDQQILRCDEWVLCAHHTPGHLDDHLSFQLGDVLFCGDVILGWSSTLISPPQGDLIDYFRSLDRIEALRPQRLYPAHGAPIDDVPARIEALRSHRKARTAQILGALDDHPATAAELASRLYNVPEALLPAATRNVLAHLRALDEIGAVTRNGPANQDAIYARNQKT